MELHRAGNLIEAGVWAVLALALFVYALKSEKSVCRLLLSIAVTLVVFGASDLVEARTGAWWKPWWLLVWKAACVMTLFFGFVRYYQITRRGTASPESTNSSPSKM